MEALLIIVVVLQALSLAGVAVGVVEVKHYLEKVNERDAMAAQAIQLTAEEREKFYDADQAYTQQLRSAIAGLNAFMTGTEVNDANVDRQDS